MTDLFIKNGSLPNFSDPLVSEIVPVFLKEPKYDFDHITETRTFEITAEVTGNFEIGMNFNIPLINPPQGQLICEISSYESELLTIKFFVDNELNREHLIFEQIIVKVKGVELFALPGMKSGQLTIKGIPGIITPDGEISGHVDSSKVSTINDKKNKYLSDSSSHIYDDTLKCIENTDTQEFYIHGNEKKKYIFVSVSNSNIKLYSKNGYISSLNYISYYNPDNNYYYIISEGIGCFQIYYL